MIRVPTKSQAPPTMGVVLALVGAMVLQLSYALAMDSWGDEAFYLSGAHRHFFQGERLYSANNPAVYPPLAFAVWTPPLALFGLDLVALRIQSCLFTLALLASSFQLASQLQSTRAGWLTLAMFASTAAYAPLFSTVTPYGVTALLVVSAYLIVAPNPASGWRLALFAGVLGVVSATRHNVAVGLGLGWLYFVWRSPHRVWHLATLLAAGAVYACAIAPFAPEIWAILPNPPWMSAPAKSVPFSRPGMVWEALPALAWRFVRSTFPFLILTIVVGINRWKASHLSLADGRQSQRDVLVSLSLTTAAVFLLHLVGPLFFAPDLICVYFAYTFPLACIVLGVGVDRWLADLGELSIPRWSCSLLGASRRWIAVGVLVALMGMLTLRPGKWLGWRRGGPLPKLARTSEWIARRTTPGENIFLVSWARPNALLLANRTTFPLLENAPFSFSPDEDGRPIYGYFQLAQARQWLVQQTDCLVVWDNALAEWRQKGPAFADLLEDQLKSDFEQVDLLVNAWPAGKLRLYRRKSMGKRAVESNALARRAVQTNRQ